MIRQDTFCPSPSEQLLKAVETNSTSTIEGLISENEDLINHIYPDFDNKTIIQISVSNFIETISQETIKLLIKLGADLHYKNEKENEQQALHFATLGQNPVILQTILNHIRKDRVNDVTNTKENALHLLIREGDESLNSFEDCLDVLLKSEIDVNKQDRNGNTPVLIAVRKKYKNVIKKFLDFDKNIDVDNFTYRGKTLREIITNWNLENIVINDQNFNQDPYQKLITLINSNKEEEFLNHPYLTTLNVNNPIFNDETLLQMACEKNLKRIVEFLLSSGVDVNQIGEVNKKTPLEIASKNGFYPIFKLLLQQSSCKSNIPKDILVILLQNVIYKPNFDCDHKRCLQFLLNQEINIPVNVYKDGNTPLHYAVKYSDCETIINLLKRGASLGNKNREGVMPIDDIYAKTLEKHLDDCIKTKNRPAGDRQSTVVTFNYKTLFCSEESENYESRCLIDSERKKIIPETNVFLAISKNQDLKYLLKHPVISAFLFLKWYKMQTFFNVNFLFYIIFVLSLIGHIFIENPNWINLSVCYLLCGTFIILTLRELTEVFLAPKTYATDPENYLELFLILTTGYTIFAEDKTDLFYKQISALSILFASIEMMLLIGQYPLFSTYISVFKTVSWNFFKFMIWSAALLIAFTLGFFIIYHDPKKVNSQINPKNSENEEEEKETDFFANPFLTFIKTIAMLIGEFDASSLDLETPLNKVFFLLFVFLVTITLFNVLNGLAVSDIQTIKADAEIVSLVERVNRIVYVENMLLGNTALSKFLRAFVRYFCCCNDNSKNQVVPIWIAKRVFLFPYTFRENEIQMLLFHKGEIVDNETLNNREIKTDVKKKRKFDKIYMHSKVVKSTKQLVLRNLNSDKTVLRGYLESIRRNIDELVCDSDMKMSNKHLDILSGLNAIDLMIQ